MAFAYGYVNVANTSLDAYSNASCVTYENVISREEPWTKRETVWVLGRKFNLPQQTKKFLKFVKSKLWFTYRKGFSAIGGTGPTSDAGWGCMLRCGQMMLAQALSVLTLNDDWVWDNNNERQPMAYKRILTQLSDSRSCCYSIHQIAQMGVLEGKAVGQWFGPNTVAQALKKLQQFDKENIFAFHVAMDNTVCVEEIEKLCSAQSECTGDMQSSLHSDDSPSCSSRNDSNPPLNGSSDAFTDTKTEQFWRPLFLIIPLRLGLSDVNVVYFDHLKEIFQWEESVGMIGGKPNHAYYFLGCGNNSLIFLDPHTTQTCVSFPDLVSGERFDDKTYHCDCPSKMQLSQLDPSLALGFVCLTKSQFENFCDKVKSFKKTRTSFPLFEVVQSFPSCDLKDSQVLTVKAHSRRRRKDREDGLETSDENVCLALDTDESIESDEEFEVLEFK